MLSTDRRLLNAAMDILVDAGFEDDEVLMAYATVHTYLFGRLQVASSPQTTREVNAHDTVARVVTRLPALTGRDFFEFGVDTLIAGLRERLQGGCVAPPYVVAGIHVSIRVSVRLLGPARSRWWGTGSHERTEQWTPHP